MSTNVFEDFLVCFVQNDSSSSPCAARTYSLTTTSTASRSPSRRSLPGAIAAAGPQAVTLPICTSIDESPTLWPSLVRGPKKPWPKNPQIIGYNPPCPPLLQMNSRSGLLDAE